MSLPNELIPVGLLGASSASAATQYQISRSLRFNSGDSAHLSYTPTVDGNRSTWTMSMWLKRSTLSTSTTLFSAGDNTSDYLIVSFDTNDTLRFFTGENGATNQNLVSTTAVYRDVSAWYHMVFQFDMTNATQADRLKIFVNGVRQVVSGTIAAQNYVGTRFNRGGFAHSIGKWVTASAYFNGLLSDVYFIDGLALEPTAFGEFSTTTGVWNPKQYTGVFAGNSFYLPFSDNFSNTATTLGKNDSGIGKVTYNPITNATGALPIHNTLDLLGATKGTGTRTDTNASSLVLALPLDGPNGGITFNDLSSVIKNSGSPKVVTPNGNVVTSTVTSKFYGSSAFFDGTGDFLSLASSSDFEFSTGDFTVEFWYYHISGNDRGLFANNSGASVGVNFLVGASGPFRIYNGTSANNLYDFSASPTANTWQHLAVVRRSGTVTLYVNGTSSGSTSWSGVNAGNTATFSVGSAFGDARFANGYIQDFRIYKGVAKYTTNFYPSRSAGGLPIYNTTDDFGAIRGTGTRTDTISSSLVLALPMSGAGGSTTFTDESPLVRGSGAAKTITRNGSPIVSTTQSKYYNSSGFFSSASSDNLFIASTSDFSFGSGDFTIEFWTYPTSSPGNAWTPFMSIGSSGGGREIRIGQNINNTGYGFLIPNNTNNGDVFSGYGTLPINQWNHIALVRFGSTVYFFRNGIIIATVNSVSFNFTTTSPLYINNNPYPSDGFANQYIQDFRIYKGVAKYTSTFVPPIRTDWTPNNLSINSGGPTSVASASGALPLLNTSGTYGGTLSSGVRNDSFAEYLRFAIPCGTSGGINITDQIPTGRTSSAILVNTNGGVTSTTSSFQFYGGSARISGTSPCNITSENSSSLALGSLDYTIEFWFRRNGNGSGAFETILDTRPVDTTDMPVLGVNSSGQILSYGFPQGTGQINHPSTFTNLSGWNHIACVKRGTSHFIFCNGNQIYTATSSNNPTTSSTRITIGESNSNVGTGRFTFNGDVQDARIYVGVAKYTSNFNPPSSTQLPTIAAGNDSLVDTPTNYGVDTGLGSEVRGNYATLNPLGLFPIGGGNSPTFSNGNLDISGSNIWARISTIGVSSGKWYAEFLVTGSGDEVIGIVNSSFAPTSNAWIGSNTSGSGNAYGYSDFDGRIYNNGTGTIYGNTFTTSDIIGIALDMDNGRVYFSKNGTWQNSGNPATQVNPAVTGLTGTWFMGVSNGGSGSTSSYSCNFGQRPFAYQAPSGFKSLNTANLPTPTITRPSSFFDVRLYTGNGSTQTISGLDFSPDLVWMKSRSASGSHGLFDIVRGATKALYSQGTDAETTLSGVTGFNSDGFSLGVDWNINATTFAAWIWDAGTTTVTNTQGTIQSQVRTNPSSGVSVVTYTATSGTNTIGHGLGAAPALIINKRRDSSENWYVYHTSLGSGNYLILNATNASAALSWGGAPTSSVFYNSTSSFMTNGGTYVAYCFSPISGFSAFGSYTGNGSADGPLIWTGFRPRWILWKKASTTSFSQWWALVDASRPGYNAANARLYPNVANAEDSTTTVDILSNGFKIRTSDVYENENGATYIYAAFAENPFSLARAR